jgi:PTH1 family peptidyl-tRNA hydrolase
MQAHKIPVENIFVIVDDLAIPFGKIRIRGNGSDAGHNGLKSIQELLLTQNYPRLRFGLGNNYPKGRQVDFVLGTWTQEEAKEIPSLCLKCVQAIESFVLRGLPQTMSDFNK